MRVNTLSCIRLAMLLCGIGLGTTAILASCSFDTPSGASFTPPNADELLGCNGQCHGDQTSTAPPTDTEKRTESTLRTIGAHREHLDPAPLWHKTIECADCHVVPQNVGDPGHIEDPAVKSPAEVIFSPLATADNGEPIWDGLSCRNVYCHGATLSGGVSTNPVWAVVDGTQSQCGSCHGAPPPPPHPENSADCGECHPTIQPGTTLDATQFLDPGSHINGIVEVNVDNTACDSCHGEEGISAPPKAVDGSTGRADRGVGAHRDHIGPSDWHRELFCAQCHKVPNNVNDPGHVDDDGQAELIFDELNPTAEYNAANATCSNLYCHGDGQAENGREQWTDDLELACNSCHDDGSKNNGSDMSGRHKLHIENGVQCFECHNTVIDAMLNFRDPNLHINGQYNVDMLPDGDFNVPDRRCTNVVCHDQIDDDDDDSIGDQNW